MIDQGQWFKYLIFLTANKNKYIKTTRDERERERGEREKG
jgi:hypothetical protein